MKKTLKYFLAANSCQGFVSHFADCYNEKDGWRCYIIKGGPGTGKSSFMKKVAQKAEDTDLDHTHLSKIYSLPLQFRPQFT